MFAYLLHRLSPLSCSERRCAKRSARLVVFRVSLPRQPYYNPLQSNATTQVAVDPQRLPDVVPGPRVRHGRLPPGKEHGSAMDTRLTAGPGPMRIADPQADSVPAGFRRAWHSVRSRILSGLLLVLPILITLWVIYWLYSTLEKFVIDPLALLVLWQVRGGQPDTKLPYWFETYAAPLLGILIALM